jgi:hypothetical protein
MRAPPQSGYPPVPDSLQEIEEVFGRFVFVERPGALIAPEKAWVAASILSIRLPILNQTVECHIKIERPLSDAMKAIIEAELAHEIRSCEGCYWPRHKMHDPNRELSVHSWGIAVDFNASTNMPGTKGDMHPGVIEIFARHGFYWGGNFGDPMHFQYARGY